jgi:hypothetical protein
MTWNTCSGFGSSRLARGSDVLHSITQTAVTAEIADAERFEDIGGLLDEQAIRGGAQEVSNQRLLLAARILEFLPKAGPHRRQPEMLFEDAAADPGAPAIDIVGIARRRVEGITFVLDPEEFARALADFAGADCLLAPFDRAVASA